MIAAAAADDGGGDGGGGGGGVMMMLLLLMMLMLLMMIRRRRGGVGLVAIVDVGPEKNTCGSQWDGVVVNDAFIVAVLTINEVKGGCRQ